MISTVTDSTISTITSAGSLAVIGIVLLFGLLVQKELASATTTRRFKKLDKVLNIGIWPLFLVFAIAAAAKLIEALK
jgi:hypothetical protein